MIKWRASYCFALFALLLATLTLAPDANVASAATCPPAGAITFGETIQCSISVAGEQDAFTFSAQGGDRVQVRLADLSGGALEPEFDLTGPFGSICSASGPTFSKDDCILDGTGTIVYNLLITDANGTTTGSYGLHIQRVNAPGNAVNLTFGTTTSATLALAPEADAYTFSGNSGDRVHIRMSDNTGGAMQPDFRLYGPNGSICTGNNTVLAQADCILSGTGSNTYVILAADGLGVSTGAYGIYLQRTTAPGNALAINFGDTIGGSILSQPEMDSYTFGANGGDRVHVRVADLNNGSIRPEIRLYGPTGLICSIQNSFVAQMDCLLNGTGANSYLILVDDALAASTGTYGIHVQRTNAPGKSTAISPGQTIAGQLAAIPQMNAYTFSGTGGTSVTIGAVEPSAGPLQPELRLYGPTGLICMANGSPAQTTCALSSAGPNSYTILVGDFLAASPGYYCVTLNIQSPTCADTDTDTIPDDLDNCPNASNLNQLNTDANNLTAHRPGADAIGDACDDDDDGDGYIDNLDAKPTVYCSIMRADVDGDGGVSILDFGTVSPQFIQHIPPAPARYDQDGDNAIGILDLANMSGAFLKHTTDCP